MSPIDLMYPTVPLGRGGISGTKQVLYFTFGTSWFRAPFVI